MQLQEYLPKKFLHKKSQIFCAPPAGWVSPDSPQVDVSWRCEPVYRLFDRKSVSRRRASAGIPLGDSEHRAQVDACVRRCRRPLGGELRCEHATRLTCVVVVPLAGSVGLVVVRALQLPKALSEQVLLLSEQNIWRRDGRVESEQSDGGPECQG